MVFTGAHVENGPTLALVGGGGAELHAPSRKVSPVATEMTI